jgi:enterochelin esterase family protein
LPGNYNEKLDSISLYCSALLNATAQPFGGIRNPGDTLKSIRVIEGNKVVLSIYAPKASEVTVTGDFLKEYKSLSLKKSDNGVWSVMLTDLVPDVYTYDFSVDWHKNV